MIYRGIFVKDHISIYYEGQIEVDYLVDGLPY